MVNLKKYPMTKETFDYIEKMRKISVPVGYKPIAQAKFIDRLLRGGKNVKTIKQKRKYS